MKDVYFIILLLFWSFKAYSTAQEPDYLIMDSDTVQIFTNPLDSYINTNNKIKIALGSLYCESSACIRGNVAFWKFIDGDLYLMKIITCSGLCDTKELDLNLLFGENKVKADWYSGKIIIPHGKLLRYIHGGYESIFEKETRIKVKTVYYYQEINKWWYPCKDI